MTATSSKATGLAHPAKVLFIGNSFTARNNLPGLIAQLAATRGITLQHELISAGGSSLRRHWNAGEALATINTRRFESVVLQEQSTLPIKNPERMHETVRLFDHAIQAAGAKTVLYLTWARLTAPDSQAAITDAYTRIGQELGATVIPVGAVWQSFLRQHDRPILHDRDGSHPSLAGSYLAACVFLAALFHQTAAGAVPEIKGLSSADQLLLQKTAWQACQNP